MLHYLLLIFLGTLSTKIIETHELSNEITFDTRGILTLNTMCNLMRTETFLNLTPTLKINTVENKELFKTLASLLYIQTCAHHASQQKKWDDICLIYQRQQVGSTDAERELYHSVLRSIQKETNTFCHEHCQRISRLYGAFNIPYISHSPSPI